MKKQTKGYLMVAAAGILYFISALFKKLPSPPQSLCYILLQYLLLLWQEFFIKKFAPFKTVALLLCIGGCFFAATKGSMN